MSIKTMDINEVNHLNNSGYNGFIPSKILECIITWIVERPVDYLYIMVYFDENTKKYAWYS